MSFRVNSFRIRIEELQSIQRTCEAEAIMLRKIADDLMGKANKLDETASYHDREIAMLQGRLRDEEAKL